AAQWKQFEDAHKLESRIRYAQQLQNVIATVVANQQDAVANAEQLVRETKAHIEQLGHDRARCSADVSRAKQVCDEHERRQKDYQELDVRLAEEGGAIQTTKKDIEKLKGQIVEAEQCAGAAQEHAQLYISINELQTRLSSLPLVKERHTILHKAGNLAHDLARQLKGLESVDIVLQEAQKKESEAKQKVDELQEDPTTEEFQAWNARAA